jgi:hypothetical protein
MHKRGREMSEFKRQERYIVIKLANLTSRQHEKLPGMMDSFASACVNSAVVESDWPEFEPVWRMIEARATGTALPHYDALAAQRDEGLAREAKLQRRLAEAENQIRLVAHTAGDLLEQVINATELFDEPISDEEIDETNAVIDSALAFAGPESADGESAECAHSYANKLGCPECGEDFGK